VDNLGQSNPLLFKVGSGENQQMFGEPKRLMPNFPRKQGKHFRLNLGQDVSEITKKLKCVGGPIQKLRTERLAGNA
jgi:hypothetical protein